LNELLALSLLGGILALDGTSVGQFMISRPIVAGALAGTLSGALAEGFLVGMLLEIYLLVSFPVGGSRFPEGGPATVVAVAVAVGSDHPGAVALGVTLGLVWGQVAGFSVTALRTINARLLPDPASGSVTRQEVVVGHLGAVVLDFLRGFVVTGLGVWVGWNARLAAAWWSLSAADTRGFLLVGGAVSLGILIRGYGGLRRRGLLFGTGLVLGALGGVFL